MNFEKEDNIDHDRFSRQIRTYGIQTTKILSKLKIFIFGLRGFGIEIAKNIILSNPKQVSIFDDNICQINDLGSNYFLSNENVLKKERRDNACLKKLSELNPNTKVNIENDFLAKIKEYDVVIITEIMKSAQIYKINKECHENNKGFIYSLSCGLFGFIFSDFGDKHIITDKTGKEKRKFYITDITKDKNGILKIDYNNTDERILNNGYLIFKQVEGMVELNSSTPRPYQVNEEKNDEIFIGDTSNFGDYTGGGIIEEYFFPISMKYKLLEDNIMNPTFTMMKYDYSENKKERQKLLHILFIFIQKFYDINEKLPDLNNEKESSDIYNQIISFSKNITGNDFFSEMPHLDENLLKDLIKFSRAQHPSLCSFLGGFVAQEAIKFTGLYSPLNQWFWIDIYDETIINLSNADRTLKNSRYDDLIAIYGNEIIEKLHKSNIFLIGAGAVGSEYLKILSLIGVSTEDNYKVIVTDNDCIENSNLNRQFLFRKEHIGKSKSLVACQEVKKINPDFHCEGYQVEVREENEDLFNEDFYKKQDFVLIAVDNVKARMYINNQCTLHGIKLIECGTLGEQASSQLIIPFTSDEYKGSEKNTKFGVCTIRNIPSIIEHCIEWSGNKFSEYFDKNIKNLKNFLNKPKSFFEENDGEDYYEKLIYLKEYLKIYKTKSYDNCLIFAKKIFNLNFKTIIEDILIINPPNKKSKDGSNFWKGSNRLPHILKYEENDNYYYYLEYFSYLLAESLGIPINTDKDYKIKFCKLITFPKNEEILFNLNFKNELKYNEEKLKKIPDLEKELLLMKDDLTDNNNEIIHEQIFEKDHDENHHVDFLYFSSILRANNFNIDYCSRDKIKFVSGNIVPSIPTTTASIVGFISSQIFTLLQTLKLENLRQINIDLSTPFALIYRPKKVYQNRDTINKETKVLTKAVPPLFTCWDCLEIKGNMTLDEVINYINIKYKVSISGIYTLNSINIIKDDSFYELKFQDAYYKVIEKNEKNKSNSIYFRVLADEMDNEDVHVVMPKFKYIPN